MEIIIHKEIEVTDDLLDKLKFCKNCEHKEMYGRNIEEFPCIQCLKKDTFFFEKNMWKIN